jgi:plastocyanin
MPRLAPFFAAIALAAIPTIAVAAGEPEFNLMLEDHKFSPERIEIPAGQKVKLLVENKDATAEEFDSDDLRIEKVIGAKSRGTIWVGPLKAGEYNFMGEYHDKTARGVVVAK